MSLKVNKPVKQMSLNFNYSHGDKNNDAVNHQTNDCTTALHSFSTK